MKKEEVKTTYFKYKGMTFIVDSYFINDKPYRYVVCDSCILNKVKGDNLDMLIHQIKKKHDSFIENNSWVDKIKK